MSIQSFLRTFCGRQFMSFTGTAQRLCALPIIESDSAYAMHKIVPPSVTVIQARGYKKRITVPKTLKPLNFDGSGDLVQQQELNPTQTHFLYKDFDELQTAPESVKKIFSLEYASGQEKLLHRHLVVQDNVNKLTGPAHNLEKQIAFMTVKIQNLKPYIVSRRMDKKEKSHLLLRIKKRNKILRYLRHLDIDRFNWITNELKIKYQPVPQYNRRETHRARARRLLRDEANDMKRQKISDLRARLDEEKVLYYKHKKVVLAEIDADIAKFELDREKIMQDNHEYLEAQGSKLREELRWKDKQPGKFAQYYLMKKK